MKYLPVLFSLLVAMAACSRKTAPAAGAGDVPATDSLATESEEYTPPVSPPRYLVAAYEKTACFGKCPVFQVRFYNDGLVTWNGRMNVERMGLCEARVDEAVLRRIKDKAKALHYFDLAPKYPERSEVADLPSTITYVRIGDMEKQVVNTYEAPENLIAFEQFLAELIEQLEWKPQDR